MLHGMIPALTHLALPQLLLPTGAAIIARRMGGIGRTVHGESATATEYVSSAQKRILASWTTLTCLFFVRSQTLMCHLYLPLLHNRWTNRGWQADHGFIICLSLTDLTILLIPPSHLIMLDYIPMRPTKCRVLAPI